MNKLPCRYGSKTQAPCVTAAAWRIRTQAGPNVAGPTFDCCDDHARLLLKHLPAVSVDDLTGAGRIFTMPVDVAGELLEDVGGGRH